MRLGGVLVLLAIALTAQAQTRDRTLTIQPSGKPDELRHALVIGNSNYLQGPLRNPVNDARAMAKALGAAGFHVRVVEDATHIGMQRAVRQWGDDIAKGGVGLFYYAGHGLQVKGRNYLVPVNAEIDREDEIDFSTLDVNFVLAKMDSAKNPLNIVILDACRNNPFARSFRSVSRGLAQMDAPTGTFIAFATAPGSVASDGSGVNGLYTEHLLREMRKPGVPIEQMFKQVRNGVMNDTKGQQIPWESSSMRGDFSFLGAPPVAAAPAAPATPGVSLAEMEKMIQAALDKQRAMLEAQGLKVQAADKAAAERAAAEKAMAEAREQARRAAEERAAAQKAVAELAAAQKAAADQAAATRLAAERARAERVASEKAAAERAAAEERARAEKMQLALAAPIAAAPLAGGDARPRTGDTWTYRLNEPNRQQGAKQRNYVVRVTAASAAAILEQFSIEGEASREWAHSPGSYLLDQGAALFSPYLPAFQDLAAGESLGRVQISDPACTKRFVCEADGKVVGTETVRVPAGSFQAVKVLVRQSWRPISNEFQQQTSRAFGSRDLTIWYSPQARRAVKFRSRLNVGDFTPMETDFDLELTTYELK